MVPDVKYSSSGSLARVTPSGVKCGEASYAAAISIQRQRDFAFGHGMVVGVEQLDLVARQRAPHRAGHDRLAR